MAVGLRHAARESKPTQERAHGMHAGNLANRLHETSCAQKQPPMRVCCQMGAGCKAPSPVPAMPPTAVLLKQFSMK
jgi:hypothetical protein